MKGKTKFIVVNTIYIVVTGKMEGFCFSFCSVLVCLVDVHQVLMVSKVLD